MNLNVVITQLQFLLDIEPNRSLLSACCILKSIKKFKDEFIDSNDPSLKSLAKLCHKLYLHWKRRVMSERLGIPEFTIKPTLDSLSEYTPKPSLRADQILTGPKLLITKIPKQKSTSKIKDTLEISQVSNDENSPGTSVANPNLRKQACQKIVKILMQNRFEQEKARELTLIIENNLRKKDPSMQTQYRRFFKAMIKDIRKLDRDSFDKSNY